MMDISSLQNIEEQLLITVEHPFLVEQVLDAVTRLGAQAFAQLGEIEVAVRIDPEGHAERGE